LNKALLDTDIYSEILKAANPTVTANATNYRRAQGFLTFSTVTVMEVVRGFQKNQSTRRLNAFLAAIALEEILPFDQPAAELAGRIAGELERKWFQSSRWSMPFPIRSPRRSLQLHQSSRPHGFSRGLSQIGVGRTD
jgi:predicted nucleic acid-binding protein